MKREKELSALESRDMMRETKGYQEGVEHERMRVIAHLEDKQRNGYSHISVERMIEWMKGGDE